MSIVGSLHTLEAGLTQMADTEGEAATNALILAAATPNDRLKLARSLIDLGLTRKEALEIIEKLRKELAK